MELLINGEIYNEERIEKALEIQKYFDDCDLHSLIDIKTAMHNMRADTLDQPSDVQHNDDADWRKELHELLVRFKDQIPELSTLPAHLHNFIEHQIQSARNDAAAMGFSREELKFISWELKEREIDMNHGDTKTRTKILAKLDKILGENK